MQDRKVRVLPDELPPMELIGKAMARGWGKPTWYFYRPITRGSFLRGVLLPGGFEGEMFKNMAIAEGSYE